MKTILKEAEILESRLKHILEQLRAAQEWLDENRDELEEVKLYDQYADINDLEKLIDSAETDLYVILNR